MENGVSAGPVFAQQRKSQSLFTSKNESVHDGRFYKRDLPSIKRESEIVTEKLQTELRSLKKPRTDGEAAGKENSPFYLKDKNITRSERKTVTSNHLLTNDPDLTSFNLEKSSPLFQASVDPELYLKELDNVDRARKAKLSSSLLAKFQLVTVCKVNPKQPVLHSKGETLCLEKVDFGSFHFLCKSTFHPAVLFRFVRHDLPSERRIVKDPEIGQEHYLPYRHYVLYQGYQSYLKLKKEGVRVPKLFNKPLEDGYYKIEHVPHEVDTSSWAKEGVSYENLSPKHQEQLQQVKKLFDLMRNRKEAFIYDFKPHNARFDATNQLVVIDFCEDPTITSFLRDFKTLIAEYIDAWSGGNPRIKAFLLGSTF